MASGVIYIIPIHLGVSARYLQFGTPKATPTLAALERRFVRTYEKHQNLPRRPF